MKVIKGMFTRTSTPAGKTPFNLCINFRLATKKIRKTSNISFIIGFILFMKSDIEHEYNKYIIHIVCTDKSFACVFGPNKFLPQKPKYNTYNVLHVKYCFWYKMRFLIQGIKTRKS